jgi:tetratricopeptide (TPR) repeat protein
VHLEVRDACLELGALGQMLDNLRAAERLAEALDDPRRLGWICCHLCNYFYRTGAHDQALAAGQRALSLATACGDGTLQAMTQFNLGVAYFFLGDYAQAIDLLRQNMVLLVGERRYERVRRSLNISVLSHMLVVRSLAERGAFAEGIAHGEEGVRIAETVDLPGSLVRMYWGVSHLYLRKGDFQKAIPRLERGMRLCQEANIPVFFPTLASGLGYAYALSGLVAEALAMLEQAVAQYTSMPSLYGHDEAGRWLSEVYWRAGRLREATDQARRTLELTRACKERGHQAWILRLLGDMAMHHDPPKIEQAEAHYQQALGLADELGMRPLQAHCHRGLGTLYIQIGQAEQARAELSTAIEMYRDMEMTFWLPETEAALAEVEKW